jgi:hypothetical protein
VRSRICESIQGSSGLLALERRDPTIPLPEFYVLAVNELLGAFFGRLFVGTKNISAFLDMPIRA